MSRNYLLDRGIPWQVIYPQRGAQFEAVDPATIWQLETRAARFAEFGSWLETGRFKTGVVQGRSWSGWDEGYRFDHDRWNMNPSTEELQAGRERLKTEHARLTKTIKSWMEEATQRGDERDQVRANLDWSEIEDLMEQIDWFTHSMENIPYQGEPIWEDYSRIEPTDLWAYWYLTGQTINEVPEGWDVYTELALPSLDRVQQHPTDLLGLSSAT